MCACASVPTCAYNVYARARACDEIRIIPDIHLLCSWRGDWVGLGDMMALSQRITLLSSIFSLLSSALLWYSLHSKKDTILKIEPELKGSVQRDCTPCTQVYMSVWLMWRPFMQLCTYTVMMQSSQHTDYMMYRITRSARIARASSARTVRESTCSVISVSLLSAYKWLCGADD